MRTAWKLVQKCGFSLRDAIIRAWKLVRLKIELATTDEKGKWIKYRKISTGEVRQALATRNIDHVPAVHKPKTTGVGDLLTITYFDLLADGWRCFKADQLILS